MFYFETVGRMLTFEALTFKYGDRDSAVGIATRCGQDGLGI